MASSSGAPTSPSPPSPSAARRLVRSKPALVVVGSVVVAAVLVYVLLYGGISGISQNATRLPPQYTVTFHETGLPAGESWQVTLGPYMTHGPNSTVNTTSSTIQFVEPNGLYVFVVSSVTSYIPDPRTAEALVNGSNVSIRILFNGVPLGTVFSWGTPVNASGTTSPGCGPPTTQYCYSIEIAGANRISTSNVLLSLQSDFGATVGWSPEDVVSLFTPTNASAVATYDPSLGMWSLFSPFSGQLSGGDTLWISTPATESAGLLGVEIVAVGESGYSGSVASTPFY